MNRLLSFFVLAGLVLSACTTAATTQGTDEAIQQADVTVFKAPN